MQIVEIAAFAALEDLWPLRVVDRVAMRTDAVFQRKQASSSAVIELERQWCKSVHRGIPGWPADESVVRMNGALSSTADPGGGQLDTEHAMKLEWAWLRNATECRGTRQRNRAGGPRRLQSPAAPWPDRNADRIRLRARITCAIGRSSASNAGVL